jgi:hypothetical protein
MKIYSELGYDGKVLWQILPQQHIREKSPYTGINYEPGNNEMVKKKWRENSLCFLHF